MPRFGGMGGAFGRVGGGGKVAASAAAAAFSPLNLTPALWIDPSDTATMFQSNAGTTAVTDGSVCGYAGDKSGAAFNLTSVADDTTRPTWNNNSGLPYLNFDGTNDVLRRAASLGMYAAGAISAFVAVRGNPSTTKILVGESSSASATQFYRPIESNATTSANASANVRNDAATFLITGNSVNAVNAFNNTDRVYGFTDDGANIATYVDGVADDTHSYTRSGVMTVNLFTLGAFIGVATASAFWTGRVYGVVIVTGRVISAGEIASLTTHLGAKMGLTL